MYNNRVFCGCLQGEGEERKRRPPTGRRRKLDVRGEEDGKREIEREEEEVQDERRMG